MGDSIALKIKKLRELKNFGQQYMAEKLQISQSSFSDIETGKTKINDEKLEQIAQILEVSVDQINNFNDSIVFNSNAQSVYTPTQTFNPQDKITELYERLLNEKDVYIASLLATIESLKKK